jgi:hypothetical protein
MMLGTSTVTALLDVKAGDDGRRHIAGKIGADRVAIVPLIAMLTDKSSAPAGDSADADGSAASEWQALWPSGLFNFAALNDSDADIRLSFGSLGLSGNLATRDGEMRLAVTPNKIAISELSAAAAGGKLTGEASLEKASNGVTFVSNLKLGQAKLSSFSAAAQGLASFDLSGGATAQSPAGLVAVLSGEGHATLKGATIHGPAPLALSEIVDDVLLGKMQNDPHAISAAFLTSLNTSAVSLGDRDIAITLTDGSVKFDTLTLESPGGKLEATVSTDLTSLKVNAAFQVISGVKPLPPPEMAVAGWKPPPAKGPLPPAIVLYDGPLDNLSVIKSSVDVVDLQRELSVRQVERNVEELERARHGDEERARLEKARRKAAEEQRAQASKPHNETPGWETDDVSDTGAEPQAVPNPPIIVPQAETQDGSGANSVSATTLQGQKITIAPIPESEGVAAQTPVGPTDPETGLPIQASPPTATRSNTSARPVQRRRERQRTSSDEVMKQLGGFH